MPPPGVAPVASAHLFERGGGPRGNSVAQRVSDLIKTARTYKQLDHIGHRRLAALVNAYISQDVERDLVAWVLTYADTTGDTAADNVDRERAHR